MVRQFQAPLTPFEGLGVLEVARVTSMKLVDLQGAAQKQRANELAALATELSRRIVSKLRELGAELEHIYRSNDP